MKTMKMTFVRFFLVFGFMLISLTGNSQDRKLTHEERKEIRKERKEVRKAEKNQNYFIIDSLLNAKSFVLEATSLQNKYGRRVPVNPTLNFIIIDNPNGVIQTGSDTRIGYNDVGGVTAEGSIGLWKVHKDPEKQVYTVSFNLFTQIGNFDVLLKVNSGNNASATISGVTSGKLTWHGHLSTVDNARIFKGRESI